MLPFMIQELGSKEDTLNYIKVLYGIADKLYNNINILGQAKSGELSTIITSSDGTCISLLNIVYFEDNADTRKYFVLHSG